MKLLEFTLTQLVPSLLGQEY